MGNAVKQEEVMLARALKLDTHSATLTDSNEGGDIMDHSQPMYPQLKEFWDQVVGESGEVTLEDLQCALEDEDIAAYFTYLLVDLSDVNTLFRLLDNNRDSSIDMDEFISGIEQLQVRRSAAETLHAVGCKNALKGAMEVRQPNDGREERPKIPKGLKRKGLRKKANKTEAEPEFVNAEVERVPVSVI